MAFPYVFESNFELGDNSDWDSETDTAGQLDFPHYTELARFPFREHTPFRGAYCARWVLSGGTADATLTEADINIANGTTNYFIIPILFASDFDATADDTVALLELESSSTVEASFGFRYVESTDAINLGVGETAPTSFSSINLERDTWYLAELRVKDDSGGGNDGEVGLFVTKYGDPPAAEEVTLTLLDQGAITDGVFGIQDHLATTTGTILVDGFIQDDARLSDLQRFPNVTEVTKSTHVFIGHGVVDAFRLLSTDSGDVLKLYDTDDATRDASTFVAEVSVDGDSCYETPLFFSRGCFAEITGTNPRGQVSLSAANMYQSGLGPLVRSASAIKRHAMK